MRCRSTPRPQSIRHPSSPRRRRCAKDEKKNLILPARSIKEQFLVCLKGAPSEKTECFEWGVKTENGEYRFRDVGWKRSDSVKPQELFEFMKAIYPNLVSSRYPADAK